MVRDLLAFVVTLMECVVWIEVCNGLARKGLVNLTDSRKLIHIGCGLQYLLLWPLFSSQPEAKYWCGSVPLLGAVRYILVGSGILKDEALVISTSRTGDRTELLKGPVVYGVVHGVAAILFWRTSVVGLATICFLCAGDGLADVVGRRLGRSNPLPYNPRKSAAGSLACALGGFSTALAYILLYHWMGYLTIPEGQMMLAVVKLGVVVLAGTATESLPFADSWDNLTCAVATSLVGAALL